MKHWILFIALSLFSQVHACGPWYPYGDDVRFSLFSPELFDNGTMSRFYHTANQYGDHFQATPENDLNTKMWFDFCKGAVPLDAIFNAMYAVSLEGFEKNNTSDPMISYLVTNKLNAVLNYIIFAKSCSSYNSMSGGWEREESSGTSERSKLIKQALKQADNSADITLAKRYRFLALRLAFYNNEREKIEELYNAHFNGTENKDLLDYWAMHYFTMSSPSDARSNFQFAQVFAHAPGKRFAVNQAFNRRLNIDDVLALAKTDKERANIYVMYALREKGRAKESLKKIYELDPTSPLLKFLIVREINKIEDWVYTPRYGMFPPSMESSEFYPSKSSTLVSTRIEADKEYAESLASWISSCPALKNTVVGDLGSAYLYGINGNLVLTNNLLTEMMLYRGFSELQNQLSILFKLQAGKTPKFNQTAQELIMNSSSENHEDFLFAVAREFEYQGKSTMAAAFFSHLNEAKPYYYQGTVWRSPKGNSTLYSDFYHDWFFYLDGQYTPEEVEKVIEFASVKSSEFDVFGSWLRENLQLKINRLHDLVGTKYIRKNDLEAAISAFKNVQPGLWDSNDYPYMDYLDANPFYTDFNSEHNKTPGDTLTYNKLQITEKLQAMLQKAESRSTKNRSYYYFQAANCYFNMSYNGNSWMMSRYYWSQGSGYSNLEDDKNYYGCTIAKEYYQKAMETTKNKDLKALCLRMVGRCEGYHLLNDTKFSWDEDYDEYGGFHGYLKSKNESYKKLKTDYPDHYSTMVGYCTSFEHYYAMYK
jgi:hypothetical protein